jgi:hypothetical protein
MFMRMPMFLQAVIMRVRMPVIMIVIVVMTMRTAPPWSSTECADGM